MFIREFEEYLNEGEEEEVNEIMLLSSSLNVLNSNDSSGCDDKR